MLVNYKKANILCVEMGEGKTKLVLVPGINMIEDKIWETAEKVLGGHVKSGLVTPIYKVIKTKDKSGKEVEEKSAVTPDEIPNDKLDEIVNELQSEAQVDKFIEKATKEFVRAKAMNRKNKIAEEIKELENKQ